MAIKGYMESSITTSEIFKELNNANKDKDIIKHAIELTTTSQKLTNEDVEVAYVSIKQISDQLTMEAIKAFDNERTILLYNEDPSKSLTETLPFLTFRKGDDYITYVYMDRCITKKRDGGFSIQTPVLRDLLIGALIGNALKRNYSTFASNDYLSRTLMNVYTEFFSRILNRGYAIMSDKEITDSSKYYINKFFLINIFNMIDTKENIELLSTSHIKYIDDLKIEEIKNIYENKYPNNISELLSLLSELSPRMANLNLLTFLSSWINYYYVPSMLAVDNIEYLIFMTIALLSGNSMFNTMAGEIVKETKGIREIKTELLKIL